LLAFKTANCSIAKQSKLIRMIKKSNYKECLDYINNYWPQLTCFLPTDKVKHLGLPNKFITPSAGIFTNDQFYWDSYFTIIGIIKSNMTDMAKGMVENLVHLFERFNIVPMRNRYYSIGISQIPFLTSMAMEVYEVTKDKEWIKKIILTAENELKGYWMNEDLTEKHLVYFDLSRYCDHYITHLGAEHESGWDMTSRFNDKCLDILPVDLNACLYKYEVDIAQVYGIIENNLNKEKYMAQAKKRTEAVNQLMWNQKKGFYFDYNYIKKKQTDFYSTAGFYPLWANMASPEQAERVRGNLHLFETKYGLVNTQPHNLADEVKQHDYPNGWPQQHWIVIKGLLNYGFREDAERIAEKWLNMNKKLFLKTGKFWEKHDVTKGKVGSHSMERYVTQSGFGWTNAVFIRLIEELGV
jgi:alpha,alpha-trehalase